MDHSNSNSTSSLNSAATNVTQPPIPPPSGSPNRTMDQIFYIGPYTIFLVIGVAVLIITRLAQMYQVRRIRLRQRMQAQERLAALSNSQLLYNGLPFSFHGPGPVHLEMEDRIKLYERTLDRNQQSYILTEEAFEPRPNEQEAEEDIELGGDQDFYYEDEEDSPWIYLNLGANTTSTNGKEEDQSDNDKDDDAVDTSVDAAAVMTENDTTESPPRTKVSGTCIICFDDFQVGDKIVYSENHSQCKHVFHEDCMAQFLASNSMRKKPLHSSNGGIEHTPMTSYSENPCPTCRQPFCQVSQEEILVSVLLKSVKTALLDSALNTESNASTEVNEENPNNEVLNDVNSDNETNRNDDDEEEGQIRQSIHRVQSNNNLPQEDV